MIDLTPLCRPRRPELEPRGVDSVVPQPGERFVRARLAAGTCARIRLTRAVGVATGFEDHAEIERAAAVPTLVSANERLDRVLDFAALVQYHAEVRGRSAVPQPIPKFERDERALRIVVEFPHEAEMKRAVAVTAFGPPRVGRLGGGQVPAFVVCNQPQMGRSPGVPEPVRFDPRRFGTGDVIPLVQQHEAALKGRLGRVVGGRWRIGMSGHGRQSSRISGSHTGGRTTADYRDTGTPIGPWHGPARRAMLQPRPTAIMVIGAARAYRYRQCRLGSFTSRR
jgi:hypothetical protein